MSVCGPPVLTDPAPQFGQFVSTTYAPSIRHGLCISCKEFQQSLLLHLSRQAYRHSSLVKPSSNTILPNYAPKCLERWISRTNCYCRQNQAISICFRPEFRTVAGVIVRNPAQKHRHEILPGVLTKDEWAYRKRGFSEHQYED